jgi:hypothetical protein
MTSIPLIPFRSSKCMGLGLLAACLSSGVLLAQPTLKVTEPKDGAVVDAGQILARSSTSNRPAEIRALA